MKFQSKSQRAGGRVGGELPKFYFFAIYWCVTAIGCARLTEFQALCLHLKGY